ncbi:hypothetical protein JHK82_022424 [Glycine max]|nr:hypothetical protein JHK82_022424 [Glycine max]
MAMNMYIPTKLIEEMLVKLHMKSLLGLKCVKKEWNYLISHLEFAKRHFKFGQWIEKLMIIAYDYEILKLVVLLEVILLAYWSNGIKMERSKNKDHLIIFMMDTN